MNKKRGDLKVGLIAALFFFLTEIVSAQNLEGELTGFHIGTMGILLLILIVAIYFGIKSWEILGNTKYGSQFKSSITGFIIIGINDLLGLVNHLGLLNLNFLFGHFLDIIGYSIIAVSSYRISREFLR